MKKLKISFCTVSMDRLHHLKLTLRQNIIDNINYGNVEFIVIDYNSRDGLCDWVLTNMKKYLELGILKVYRADEPAYFHRCHSRNMAFKMGSGDILCNVDADNYTGPSFATYINNEMSSKKETFLTANYSARDSMGRICVKAADFHKARGYNEALSGYGYDDVDIYQRLAKTLKQQYINAPCFLKVIKHEHADRYKNEYLIANVSKIYIAYLEPFLSELIFSYRDGSVELARIIDNELAPKGDGDNIDLVGEWKKVDLQDYLNKKNTPVFYEVCHKALFEEIILLSTEMDNRSVHLVSLKNAHDINSAGYGLGRLKEIKCH
jgi:hypothetical protein